jgi:hypothetical protein
MFFTFAKSCVAYTQLGHYDFLIRASVFPLSEYNSHSMISLASNFNPSTIRCGIVALMDVDSARAILTLDISLGFRFGSIDTLWQEGVDAASDVVTMEAGETDVKVVVMED